MKPQNIDLNGRIAVTIKKHSRQMTIVRESCLGLKQRILMIGLNNYFNNSPKAFYAMLSCLNNTDRSVSLRILDWLVTNYSKAHNITYHKPNGGRQCFNVHNEYKACLKAYQKRCFDPFARRERIIVQLHGETTITTPGQMNFFKWAFSNGIIDYAMHSYFSIG